MHMEKGGGQTACQSEREKMKEKVTVQIHIPHSPTLVRNEREKKLFLDVSLCFILQIENSISRFIEIDNKVMFC